MKILVGIFRRGVSAERNDEQTSESVCLECFIGSHVSCYLHPTSGTNWSSSVAAFSSQSPCNAPNTSKSRNVIIGFTLPSIAAECSPIGYLGES